MGGRRQAGHFLAYLRRFPIASVLAARAGVRPAQCVTRSASPGACRASGSPGGCGSASFARGGQVSTLESVRVWLPVPPHPRWSPWWWRRSPCSGTTPPPAPRWDPCCCGPLQQGGGGFSSYWALGTVLLHRLRLALPPSTARALWLAASPGGVPGGGLCRSAMRALSSCEGTSPGLAWMAGSTSILAALVLTRVTYTSVGGHSCPLRVGSQHFQSSAIRNVPSELQLQKFHNNVSQKRLKIQCPRRLGAKGHSCNPDHHG